MNEKQGEFIVLTNEKTFLAYFAIPAEAAEMLTNFYQRYYLVEAAHIARQLTACREYFFDDPKGNIKKVKSLLAIQERAFLLGQIRQQQSRSIQTKPYHDWFNQFYQQPFNRVSDFWETVTDFFSQNKKDKGGFEVIVNQLKAENNAHVFASKNDVLEKFNLLASLEAIIIGMVNFMLASQHKRTRCHHISTAHRVLLEWVEDASLAAYRESIAALINNIHFIDQERITLIDLTLTSLTKKERDPLLMDSRSQLLDYAHRVNRDLKDVPDRHLTAQQYSSLVSSVLQYGSSQQINKLNQIQRKIPRSRCRMELKTARHRRYGKWQCRLVTDEHALSLPLVLNRFFKPVIPLFQLAVEASQALARQKTAADIDAALDHANSCFTSLFKCFHKQFNFRKLGWRYFYYYRTIKRFRHTMPRHLLADLQEACLVSMQAAIKQQDNGLRDSYPHFSKVEWMALHSVLRQCDVIFKTPVGFRSLRSTLKNRLVASTLLQQVMALDDQVITKERIDQMLQAGELARPFVPLHFLKIEQLIRSVLLGDELDFHLSQQALMQIKSLKLTSEQEQQFIAHFVSLVNFKYGHIPYELYDFADQLGAHKIKQSIQNEVGLFFDYVVQNPVSMSEPDSLAVKSLNQLFNAYLDTPQCIKQVFIAKARALIQAPETEFAVLAALKKCLTPYQAIPAIKRLRRELHQTLMNVDVLAKFTLPSEEECDLVIPKFNHAIEHNQIAELSKESARPIPIRLTYLTLKQSKGHHLSDAEQAEIKRYRWFLDQYCAILKNKVSTLNLYSAEYKDQLAVLATTANLAIYAREVTPLLAQLQTQLSEMGWLRQFACFADTMSFELYDEWRNCFCHSAIALHSDSVIKKVWRFDNAYDLADAVNQLRTIVTKRVRYFYKRVNGVFRFQRFFTAKPNVTGFDKPDSLLQLIHSYLRFLEDVLQNQPELKGEIKLEHQLYQALACALQKQPDLLKRPTTLICSRGG